MAADVELLPLPESDEDVPLTGVWNGSPRSGSVPCWFRESVEAAIRANVAHATAALNAEIKALRAKTAVTMGVGTGDGKLFVHGDYDSIKAAQEIVLERDALRAEVERWKSASLAQSGYAHAGEKRAADAEARAERLAEALRSKAAEWEAWGADPDHPVAGCPQDERASEIFQRCAAELRATLHPTAAKENDGCHHVNTVRGEDGVRWCQHCRQQLGQENDDA